MDRKMLFYLVVLLSLSWPRVTGAGNKKADETAFDQIATASENVAQNAEKVEQKRDNFRDQLITSMIDTTVHYENSNGFVPILISPSASPFDPRQQLVLEKGKETINATLSNSLNENENSSRIGEEKEETKETGEGDDLANDPMYSTEARILLNFSNLNANRRSFEYQGNQNDFDLLKVRNDTPEIANYPNLYEEPTSGGNILDEQSSKRSRGETRDRKLEGRYVGNYGMVVPPSSKNNEDDSYSFYYSADSAEDKERKRSHDREKVGGNYEQHRYVTGYRNEPSASSFPRLNQEVNAFLKTNVRNDVAPSSSSSSQLTNSHKFSRPVVVAEPSYNKFDQPSGISDLDTDDYRTSRITEGSSEVSHRYAMNDRDRRFENDEDSRDTSDDSDYGEYTERPRRVQQKSRRRPNGNSKRLAKEHRGASSMDDSAEHKGKTKHHSSRSRQAHRQRVRGGNSWSDESGRHQEQEDSYEDVRYDGRLSETRHAQSVKFKPSTSWNQISPNLEISHSSGIEIDQVEKPKLIVPVKVNLVPTSFDHATAIGSSQGFDVSNAILRNIVSSSANAPINSGGNEGKIRVSTPLPDIIVGQGNFGNSMHAVLPQTNGQQNDRFPPNLKPQYLSTTIAPVFTVSPNPNFQIQDTTRTTIVDPSNHISTNHAPRLILPQPTLQTLSTLVQTPVTGADYIQVNPHGMHGQNPISNGNLQVQPLPTLPTIAPTAHAIPVTKINLITPESRGKNGLLPDTDTNFLATASLAVGHNDHGQTPNDNSYYLENSNGQQIVKQPQVQPSTGFYQQTINVPPSRTKTTYVQTTNLLPAVLQPLPTYTTLSSTPSQPFQGNTGGDQGQQFPKQSVELDNAASNSRNVKFPSLAYQMIDSAASHSTDNVNTVNGLPGVAGMIGNGHLPHVGTRNVEIVNPNMKPSTFDASIINTYETMHYPAAVLTTSIPMFATTSFVTARPALLSSTVEPMQNAPVSATTEGRTSVNDNRGSNANVDPTRPYQSRDRPVYNPLEFVPNVDVVKSQNALNGKLHAVEPLQQNLNLVPLLPGGNFFKPSFSAQSELLVKPKLNSDLQAYAEQMFKESLKTIYNTQKWNNDRKAGLYNRYNVTDSDIAKLKNELQRLKASLDSGRKKKKNHDADHSETKVRTTELANRKPDELMAALEQMLKKNPSDSLHNFHSSSKPHRHRRPNEQDNYSLGTTGDPRDSKYVKEFLTPPQFNSHRGKNHFQTVDKPGKKRPGSSRYKSYNHHHHHHHHHHHGPRSHPRSNSKAGGIEVSGSNIEPVRVDGHSKYGNIHDSRQFRKGSSFDSHLGSTSPFSREKISHFSKTGSKGVGEKGMENAYNNPKMHNFYGMLMKNKQLPGGDTPNYFRDKDQLKQFFETEKQRMQQKFYDDALRDYFKKMSDLGYTGISNSRISSPEKRKV
ncbi:uncharacterized protein LOC122713361 [Apis laboriosa]|uniref:uncharacterized protein LOC122713361 n=1 Tax=Apis laboriosa TaxID=183418 RepID=UPI001CC69627|nr:uncharacterized protein LOC122713361 [Apis laboriosa]